MVDVVEAMMTSRSDALRRRRQHLALEIDHLGHAFEHDAGVGERGSHVLRRHHGDPGDDGFGVRVRQQSEPRQARQRFLDFAERVGFERRELLRGTRLDVDHGDGVAGIGEGDRDAAAHAAGAETGDAGASGRHRPKPSRSRVCNSSRLRSPRPRLASVRPSCHEILAADRAADGEKRLRQRRRDAGQFGDRNQKRQAEPQDPPACSDARSARCARASRRNRSGDRASRGHTSIARLRWRNDGPAENAGRHSRRPSRTAMRSASSASVTRRIDGLRAFLVDVPALEMLDRAGIHDDQRRMDDRAGIHQRARQRVAARLDHAGKGASDHLERMVGAFSGNTPTGSRLARMVMATSNGPCLRVSHGSVPVSAKLTAARLPASRAALAKIIEPNVAGGRNTTWPSARCGASSRAISCCAKAGAGHRISSASRTASAMSDRHQRQLHVVAAVDVLDE